MAPRPRAPRAADLAVLDAIEEMLCARTTHGQIVAQLGERFAISERTAKRRIATVYARWKAESETERPHRREQQRRALGLLHRAAFEARQYGVCVRVEALLAKIDGTEVPASSGSARPVEMFADFEGRSSDELLYYAERGEWPDEMSGSGAVSATG